MNQYDNDPRQTLFLKYYLNPDEKDTFSNSYASAIKAGYSESYAREVVAVGNEWLEASKSKYNRILQKAENKLESLLDCGDNKIEADIAKFASSRLNKKVFSERLEQTGADGSDLKINIINFSDTTRSAILPE
jgi:phage terminase small subunit